MDRRPRTAGRNGGRHLRRGDQPLRGDRLLGIPRGRRRSGRGSGLVSVPGPGFRLRARRADAGLPGSRRRRGASIRARPHLPGAGGRPVGYHRRRRLPADRTPAGLFGAGPGSGHRPRGPQPVHHAPPAGGRRLQRGPGPESHPGRAGGSGPGLQRVQPRQPPPLRPAGLYPLPARRGLPGRSADQRGQRADAGRVPGRGRLGAAPRRVADADRRRRRRPAGCGEGADRGGVRHLRPVPAECARSRDGGDARARRSGRGLVDRHLLGSGALRCRSRRHVRSGGRAGPRLPGHSVPLPNPLRRHGGDRGGQGPARRYANAGRVP